MRLSSLIIECCWGVLFAYWIISSRDTYKTKRSLPFSFDLLRVFLFAVVVFGIYGMYGHRFLSMHIIPRSALMDVLCVIIVVCGMAFAIWARRVLGRNWSGNVTVKEGHELIVTGPYVLVRHPIYTGILTMVLGTFILIGTVSVFLALLVMCLGFVIKFRAEERLMTETFGEEYIAYKSRTKALIPKIL